MEKIDNITFLDIRLSHLDFQKANKMKAIKYGSSFCSPYNFDFRNIKHKLIKKFSKEFSLTPEIKMTECQSNDPKFIFSSNNSRISPIQCSNFDINGNFVTFITEKSSISFTKIDSSSPTFWDFTLEITLLLPQKKYHSYLTRHSTFKIIINESGEKINKSHHLARIGDNNNYLVEYESNTKYLPSINDIHSLKKMIVSESIISSFSKQLEFCNLESLTFQVSANFGEKVNKINKFNTLMKPEQIYIYTSAYKDQSLLASFLMSIDIKKATIHLKNVNSHSTIGSFSRVCKNAKDVTLNFGRDSIKQVNFKKKRTSPLFKKSSLSISCVKINKEMIDYFPNLIEVTFYYCLLTLSLEKELSCNNKGINMKFVSCEYLSEDTSSSVL